MHNLFRFIKLNQALLLFILIEGISISLLINNNSYQNNKTIKVSTQITGYIYEKINLLSNYLALKEKNDYLAEENAKLKTLFTNYEIFIDSTFIKNKKFKYIAAKVIKNSVKKRNNFLTINKGIKHGFKNGMGVVTSEGVIGIVHSVSQNYSLIISLLHHKSATGIFLKKNMHTGILKWHGFDYRIATIQDLPVHIPLNIGDTIITNSYSNIYPEGINIGTVTNFKKNDYGFYNTNIKLLEDFNNLRYVYVVYSSEANEQLRLEKKIKNE